MTSRSQEVSARTVDEAIQIGLGELDVGLDEVEVVVLDRGRTGILGIGSEPARVRLTVRSGGDGAARAHEVLETLLRALGVDGTIYIVSPAGETPIAMDIQGEDAGILIGRQGRTLSDLQFLVNVLVSRKVGERVFITLDVEGYKKRRFDRVRSLALRMAERVRQRGEPVTLEPMGAAERRVVHMTLSGDSGVTTHSEGSGENRQVTISPR